MNVCIPTQKSWRCELMKVEKVGNEHIVYPEGRIDIASATEFQDTIISLIDEGAMRIVLDFSKVTGLDSSGLGKLLLLQKRVKEKGGKIVIKNVASDFVKKMFTLVHLDRVIEIKES